MQEDRVILIDSDDSFDSSMEADFYRKLGHPIEQCPGPHKSGGCPILRGERCPLVEAADGVLFQLDLDIPENRRVLSKYITYFGKVGVPVRAVVTPEQNQRWAKLLSMVEVSVAPIDVGKLDGFSAEIESGWDQSPKPRPASGREPSD